MQISMQVEGVDRLKQRNAALVRELETELMREVRAQAVDVRREARAIAPKGVTGNLRRSIRIRSSRRELSATVKSTAPHTHLVTKGRRPGKAPPSAALRAWAKALGLEGKEFILARAIGRRGTTGVPFMGLAKQRTEGRFGPRVQAAVQRVLGRFGGRS